MSERARAVAIPLASLTLIAGCGGSSSPDTATPPPPPATGTISVSITDDLWHDMDSMVITITGMDFGHNNGDVHSFDIPGGPVDVDMVQLQKGVHHALMSAVELPGRDYDWMRLRIDVNHPNFDPAERGNWMYAFPGDAEAPDDIADTESDGVPGPITTDRVEMNSGTGAHEYHFGYLPGGMYRLTFACSGERDEASDDDYPYGPDGKFVFQHFSGPVEIDPGQMKQHDL